MKHTKILTVLAMAGITATALTGCNKDGKKDYGEGTGGAVAEASEMTLAELEEASRKEMEGATDTFKVVGLTSVLDKIAKAFSKKYEWIHYGEEGVEDNVYVNNSYKDYQLLAALDTAEDQYFADYALVQDVRSFSAYIEDGITHNYVPSDWQSLGLKEEDTLPLKGVHFNKLFWTNTNFETVNGFKLYNIWQVAGKETDKDHCSKVSFQSPVTEQINMSFLAECYAENNQARIAKAYKEFYGQEWAPSDDYQSAGQQWVTEFIQNLSRLHSSDGTAMKETQLKDDWREGYVYYGAFAKMKDAVSKYYTVEGQDTDPILRNLIETEGDNAGKINALKTVKWDWEIEGFNGFMYCMDSQIVNNAKFPYTACLYARCMLEEEFYTGAIYNSSTPNAAGEKANQYGYYFPGTASNTFRYAAGDWTKEQHIEKEINEDYNYLKDVRTSVTNSILTMIAAKK